MLAVAVVAAAGVAASRLIEERWGGPGGNGNAGDRAGGQRASPAGRAAARERARRLRASARVSRIARRLPLERRVAQLFLVGFEGRDPSAPVFGWLREAGLGGLVIEARNYEGPDQLAALAGEAGVVANQVRRVPPWVLVAQEGGRFSELEGLPPAKPPSRLASPREASRAAAGAARALRRLSVNGVLAPVADVGAPEGGTDPGRAYSDVPRRVAGFAAATVRSYSRARILSAPKHFPGLGASTQSTEDGPAQVGLSLAELADRDLVPFRAAIRAGAPAIVVGHGLYATDDFVVPASLSRTVVTGLLRRGLRFRGVAIADDLASPAVTALTSVPRAAVASLRAGADLLYISGPESAQRAAHRAVVRAARSGAIPRRRIEEAVLRALTVKERFGLRQR